MTTGMKHLAAYQANLLDYNAAKDRECNYIGNQIRAARKSMKLSLEQLSQILMGYGVDIGRVAVNKWEKGISIPSAYQLLAVCAALHLEDGFDYFVSNTKRPLLNAEGRRKVKEYREDLIASGKYREVPPVLEIRYLDMPVSDLPVSAGTGAFLDEGNFEMVSFPESSIPDGQGYIKAYAEQEPDDPEAYLSSDGVRRMQPVMVSYNKAYAPKPASPELEFRIVGRVL